MPIFQTKSCRFNPAAVRDYERAVSSTKARSRTAALKVPIPVA
jgi:hypothetical protein